MASAAARLGTGAESRDNLERARAIFDARFAERPKSLGVLNDVADIYLQMGDFERADLVTAIPKYRRSLEAADQAAAVAPKDFSVAFRQVMALEGLARALDATGAADEASGLRQRLVELWTKWDGLQPGSTFIQNRLREARQARPR